MHPTNTNSLEHDEGNNLARSNVPKEESSLTEEKINEISKKLDELTMRLEPILRIDKESPEEIESTPQGETKILTDLAIIEEDVTYLLNNIIL